MQPTDSVIKNNRHNYSGNKYCHIGNCKHALTDNFAHTKWQQNNVINTSDSQT
jgi:hypothetical protein